MDAEWKMVYTSQVKRKRYKVEEQSEADVGGMGVCIQKCTSC